MKRSQQRYGDPTRASLACHYTAANVLDFGDLPVRDVRSIVDWLRDHFEPWHLPYRLGTYRLKHVAERSGLPYVRNGEFGALIQLAGFELAPSPVYPSGTYYAYLRPKPESRALLETLEVAAGYRNPR